MEQKERDDLKKKLEKPLSLKDPIDVPTTRAGAIPWARSEVVNAQPDRKITL